MKVFKKFLSLFFAIVLTLSTAALPVKAAAIGMEPIPPTTIRTLSKGAPENVIMAFSKLGYIVKIKSKASYAGFFDGKTRMVTLRSKNNGYMLHELGHFVSFVSGFRDSTTEFKNIYNKEKSKYTGSNKAYVTKNSEEYFAESFRDYCKSNSSLKKNRPLTYNYIKSSISAVNDTNTKKISNVYYNGRMKDNKTAKEWSNHDISYLLSLREMENMFPPIVLPPLK